MPFVGRERELALLERAYGEREGAFIPVYGRRRVGKSELILRFLEGRPAVYFLGKQAPAALQKADFCREAAAALDQPLLEALADRDWKQILVALDDQLDGDRKLVLVLDEVQWLVETSPELPSVLQELWDRRWRRSGKVMLILCGSYLAFMEREILGRESPLFGRRTAQILLKPFDHLEAALFHPGWSHTDHAKARFVCGGVPMYLERFDRSASVESNIIAALLDDGSPLYREAEFLLREELRDVHSYHAILRAIAGGEGAHSAIARVSSVPARSLHYYLEQLIGLGYVRRRYPLTGRRPTPRQVRYTLDDALLRFWFRFVAPHISYLEHMGPHRAFADRIKPGLAAYWGLCFEQLCREALPRIYLGAGVHASFEVGEYWDRDVQIDIVGLRDDGWIDLGECRWGAVRSPNALAAELDERVARYPNRDDRTIARHFFMRKKPTGHLPDGAWHDLDELYEEPLHLRHAPGAPRPVRR